jgi:RimJ/RimL family protein N-acetyltransferase
MELKLKIKINYMLKVTLRKIELFDKKYFAKWWRNKDLLKLTSGILKVISDKEVDKYFQGMLYSKKDYHFMIIFGGEVIGHINLSKRKNNWYETQIVIGEKKYWGRDYGTAAIKQLIKKAKLEGIAKIYLEVRPDNLRAIHAYKKCGFIEKKIIKYPKNKYLPETLRMELE